jgi:TonB family protein
MESGNRVEGWVVVSLMVDPQGRPFEAGVVSSTGNRTFERLAVQAMEHASFTPATLNGTAVESVYETRYTFVIDDLKPGARPGFIKSYKALQAAFQTGDREAADAAMGKLKVTTLYEDAYYGLAQYNYAARWGDDSQRAQALSRALGGAQFLTPQERQGAQVANLNLLVQQHDYYDALQMWQQLQSSAIDPGIRAKLEKIVAQIRSLRTTPGSYTMSGTIPEGGAWGVHLFKRSFHAAAASGVISQVKLRCQKGFASFAFNPDLLYNVAAKYGQCTLSLEGTPGTELTLTQS